MTTKEFNRRCAFYKSLDFAAGLFDVFDRKGFIYKVTCISSFNSRSIWFEPEPKLPFLPDALIDCQYLCFDKFDKADFLVQFRYFKSFYMRCSKLQQATIDKSLTLSRLVGYLRSGFDNGHSE